MPRKVVFSPNKGRGIKKGRGEITVHKSKKQEEGSGEKSKRKGRVKVKRLGRKEERIECRLSKGHILLDSL
jgi:hypothetical protein